MKNLLGEGWRRRNRTPFRWRPYSKRETTKSIRSSTAEAYQTGDTQHWRETVTQRGKENKRALPGLTFCVSSSTLCFDSSTKAYCSPWIKLILFCSFISDLLESSSSEQTSTQGGYTCLKSRTPFSDKRSVQEKALGKKHILGPDCRRKILSTSANPLPIESNNFKQIAPHTRPQAAGT